MRTSLVAALAVFFVSCAASLCAADKPVDAVQLFNGKDLSNWTWVSDKAGSKIGDVWSVLDGVLYCTGNPRGYIRTKRDDYHDYVLTVEWRWPKGGKGGNNGVLAHTTTPGRWASGPSRSRCSWQAATRAIFG